MRSMGQFRALCKINLRDYPDTLANRIPGVALEAGEIFEAERIVSSEGSDGMLFYKVAGTNGWVFGVGIAGRWRGLPIVEAADAPAQAATPAVGHSGGMLRVLRSDGGAFRVGWDLDDTVFSLKEAIQQKFNVPMDRQVLYRETDILSNDAMPLSQCLAPEDEVYFFNKDARVSYVTQALIDEAENGAEMDEDEYASSLFSRPTPRGPADTDGLYKVLGVGKSADEKTIRAAYRRAARTWHPDAQQDASEQEKDSAQKRFELVGFAYGVLSDPERRRVYNAKGFQGLSELDEVK
eukprot:TRINITY_DN32695_c0_g1_i2.p1 TRINITY_DN32695_c0_g1~~TRINITY_DN32695_c0_g1_i2.p1  ORF type:complete len:294 (+),score=73.88 TRINITY_DN32695_c0_g1_i2:315-1196(+)